MYAGSGSSGPDISAKKIWVDLDILVDPNSTMDEGNRVAENVKTALKRKIADLERVMVHLKPMEPMESPK